MRLYFSGALGLTLLLREAAGYRSKPFPPMLNDPQLFSIGEFSQISGLSVKALRFYDEKGLLKPAQVDATSGYRFYDAGSAERARVIARLRELKPDLIVVAAYGQILPQAILD